MHTTSQNGMDWINKGIDSNIAEIADKPLAELTEALSVLRALAEPQRKAALDMMWISTRRRDRDAVRNCWFDNTKRYLTAIQEELTRRGVAFEAFDVSLLNPAPWRRPVQSPKG